MVTFALKSNSRNTNLARGSVHASKIGWAHGKNYSTQISNQGAQANLKMKKTSKIKSSSETQGQSVGSGEKAGRTFWSTGERAPGSHQAISKNSSRCRLLIGHKKCFVLLWTIGEQFLLSSFRGFVHDRYCLATLARFVRQACASKGNFYFLLWTETKELPMSQKNVWDAISRSN